MPLLRSHTRTYFHFTADRLCAEENAPKLSTALSTVIIIINHIVVVLLLLLLLLFQELALPDTVVLLM
jgi:uncharacterized membrane protein